MTRKIKALCLAIGMTLVVSASLAPAAQAETGELTAEKYPAIATALKIAGGRFTFGNGARFVECFTDRLDATLTAATDPVTFTPLYENCFSNGLKVVPATITMNGCDYRVGFTAPGTTGDPAGTGKLTVQLVCPPEEQVEIHIYENAAKHTENKPLCTYDVEMFSPVSAGIYHNRAGKPNDVEVTLEMQITAKNTIGGVLPCGIAAGKFGELKIKTDYTLRGYEDLKGIEGNLLGLEVS